MCKDVSSIQRNETDQNKVKRHIQPISDCQRKCQTFLEHIL